MADHLRMKGKDALTIEEATAILLAQSGATRTRAITKLNKAALHAVARRDTREHMRNLGATAAKKAGYTPEQMREAAKKAGVKIVREK